VFGPRLSEADLVPQSTRNPDYRGTATEVHLYSSTEDPSLAIMVTEGTDLYYQVDPSEDACGCTRCADQPERVELLLRLPHPEGPDALADGDYAKLALLLLGFSSLNAATRDPRGLRPCSVMMHNRNQPMIAGSECVGLALTNSGILPRGRNPRFLAGNPVTYLDAVPLTVEEYEYGGEYGPEACLDLLALSGHMDGPADLFRASVDTSSDPWMDEDIPW
jgi:hypothetical protein